MLKINYPNKTNISVLEAAYKSALDVADMQVKLNDFFKLKALKSIPNPPTVEDLLTMKFEDLIKESIRLNRYFKKVHKEKLKKILNYDIQKAQIPKQQPNIAQFFSSHQDKISLCTCYYCNIDFITAFKDFGDYRDALDFVKRAKPEELAAIRGIGAPKAAIIIAERKTLKDIDDLPNPINATDKKNLKLLIVNEYSSHFTLDHVISKSDHPIAALSLYNFVPSCYSCNSKFKNARKLIEHTRSSFISPTSANNAFSNEFRFKLYFHDNRDKKSLKHSAINEFYLDLEISANNKDYERFLSIFKIHSRYVFHKREIKDLIRKKIEYNDSHISKMASILKIGVEQVKKDIFGKELFESNQETYPLTKLKRDIGKEIGIKGIR